MTLLPLLRHLLREHGVEPVTIDERASALHVVHEGRHQLVLVLDLSTTFDRLLDVARRLVRREEPEA